MSTSAKPEKSKQERERQDWLIVLLILLFGLCCVAGAGQYALRLVPSWQLDTDMGSNIDLNSQFLTGKPQQFFEPLDPAILTQPAWVNGNLFLTPGANPLVKNSTPLPTSQQDTPVPTVPATIPVGTTTLAVTTSPTNTLVWIPIPATKTSGPGPVNTPTNTSPPPVVNADLQVLQVVEVPAATTMYAAGTTLTYQVTVINNGPDTVTGARVTASLPTQVSSWEWTCTPAVASCNGMNDAAPFNDIVNLPSGGTITYTVTATIPAGVSNNLTVTVSITPPAGTTDAVANNSLSDTNIPEVDLVIAKVPGAGNYTPGNGFSYTITVTNNSTFALTGVNVTDTLSTLLTGTTWNCGPNPICTSSGSGNINDTIDMPAGPGSIATYTISGTMHPDAWGALENTASVTAGVIETDATNNSDTTSTDRAGGSSLNIGPQDGSYITLGPPFPASMTMFISPAIVADGTGNYDFVFYERLATADRVDFDWVEVWISSDGSSWYQVFNWGDGGPDGNTTIGAAGLCPTEDDNCPIDRTDLHNNTGVGINVDAIPGVSAGNYPWVMIVSPNSPGGDGSDIDAIQPYYP